MDKERKPSLLWLKITLPIVAGLVLLFGGWFLWKHVTTVVTEKKQQALYSQIQKVAELTVLKYNYSDIASTKKVRKNVLANDKTCPLYRWVSLLYL